MFNLCSSAGDGI